MLRVALQGERGAYSEEAIVALWGSAAEPLPRRTFAEALRAVETGAADAAVLPIENSLIGSVHASLAAIAAAPALHTVGDVTIPIDHCLLALPGTTLERLRWVRSHPVALAQCRVFLAQQSHLAVWPAYDTAGAAREVVEWRDLRGAAIASRAAGTRYGLVILAERIADRPDSRTRFLALAR